MNKTFAKELADAKIAHTFEIFEGDHTNQLAHQLKNKVLPLFSRTLKFQSAEKKALAPVP
jgi:hypothetical protein